ncbi:SGNH hydrolase-type esterase domain [Trinorchestia longiramus]|nr:SGNH hydrolase-type esterase domain [Trinorchestia longiramus]
MVIVQGGGNGLLGNGREATVNVIMKVVEKVQKKNVRVAVTSLLRRLACNEYEWLCKEVNRDLHEKILVMKAESIHKREVGSSSLDMDDLIQAGCFLGDGVHLLKEGETKLSQRFICWIRATHLLKEGRMDRKKVDEKRVDECTGNVVKFGCINVHGWKVEKFDDLTEKFEKGRLDCVGVVETQM